MLKTAGRINLIAALTSRGLDISIAGEAPAESLMELCAAIDREGIGKEMYEGMLPVQKEMLADAGFFSYLKAMTGAGIPADTQCKALDRLHGIGESATGYPLERLIHAVKRAGRESIFLDYLKYYAGAGLTDEESRTVRENLSIYRRLTDRTPSEMTEGERRLLTEPCMASRALIADPDRAMPLLALQPELLVLIKFLYDSGLGVQLPYECLENLSKQAPAVRGTLIKAESTLGHELAHSLFGYYVNDGCIPGELEKSAEKLAAMGAGGAEDALATRAGYVNMAYGGRVKGIPLVEASYWEEGLLIHAITNNKKGFLRLAEENWETISDLPCESCLFDRRFYAGAVNVNSLSAKNLRECGEIDTDGIEFGELEEGRVYTFEEIKALHGQPKQYWRLYAGLTAGRVDDRLITLRQLTKGGLLRDMTDNSRLGTLAAMLSRKPLTGWISGELAGIDGLTSKDAAVLLSHMDGVEGLLPQMKTRADALIAVRCKDSIGRYGTVAGLKANITEIDCTWGKLAAGMSFDRGFLARNEERVIGFICAGGAEIAGTYLSRLDGSMTEPFKRVVKAELMGKLSDLKYRGGDLSREIGLMVSAETETLWAVNTSAASGKTEACEHDGFLATMMLGEKPRKTCLSYSGGAYSECLLSCFDSNKKVLYAYKGGKTVGRAIIRLTKGTFSEQGGGNGSPSLSFADLEAETPADEGRDRLLLFLEKPYIAGIGDGGSDEVKKLFAALAERKAVGMGAMPVLSESYIGITDGWKTCPVHVYISKSKGGAQYLDSLGGSAGVSDEGGYRRNILLFRDKDAP